MSQISNSYSPNGSTVALTATTVSTSSVITGLVPGCTWYCVNAGTNPVAIRFHVNTSTGTATFPVPGTPGLGPVLAAGSTQVFELPGSLANGNPLGGFTASVVVSTIAQTGSNPIYITPLV